MVSALKGDSAPLLRLKHQAFQTESGGSPRDFSTAEYAANTCEELPFPWTAFSDPATRAGQVFAAVQAIPETAFYPFDRATTAGNDFIRMCRRWPQVSPTAYVGPPAGALPDVPVLMLSGEDDLRTPNETARSAAADWPHAQVLVVPDTGHSTLTTDFSDCTAKASRNFLLGRPVASRCRRIGQFLPALPPSPLSLRELPRARGVPGLRGKAISGAEVTVFDVTLSWLSGAVALNQNVLHGGGLRGGTWSIKLTSKSGDLKLDHLEYIPGVRVSGATTKVGTRKERTVLHLSGPRTPPRHAALRPQVDHRAAGRQAGAQPPRGRLGRKRCGVCAGRRPRHAGARDQQAAGRAAPPARLARRQTGRHAAAGTRGLGAGTRRRCATTRAPRSGTSVIARRVTRSGRIGRRAGSRRGTARAGRPSSRTGRSSRRGSGARRRRTGSTCRCRPAARGSARAGTRTGSG